MNRVLQTLVVGRSAQSLRLVLFVFFGLSMMSACSDNSPHNLRIEGLELVVKKINTECLGSGENPKEVLTEGVLDIRFAQSYTAFPVVNNIMEAAESNIVLENHHMYLVGVNLEYTVPPDQGLDALLPDDFVYTAGYLAVGSRLVVPMDVIPPDVVAEIQSEIAADPLFLQWFNTVRILVHMTIEAQLLDGRTMLSNEYTFPLKICNGCLLSSPPQTSCCPAGGPPVIGDFVYPCRFGNDEPLDCRACCQVFGTNAVDLSGKPLCENPICGDGFCESPVEAVENCPADCS